MTDLMESLVFVVHAIKQFCFGFEKLDETADDYGDGSAAKAFYLTAIYHYVAVFYLLDKAPQDPMGGAFYKALKPFGLERHLEPVNNVLLRPFGSTTFGEVVRVFSMAALTSLKLQGKVVRWNF